MDMMGRGYCLLLQETIGAMETPLTRVGFLIGGCKSNTFLFLFEEMYIRVSAAFFLGHCDFGFLDQKNKKESLKASDSDHESKLVM